MLSMGLAELFVPRRASMPAGNWDGCATGPPQRHVDPARVVVVF